MAAHGVAPVADGAADVWMADDGVSPGAAGDAVPRQPAAPPPQHLLDGPRAGALFTPLDPRMALLPDSLKGAVVDLVRSGWKPPMVSDRGVIELQPFLTRSCKAQREGYNKLRPMTPVLDLVAGGQLWLGSMVTPAILRSNAIGGVVDCTGRPRELPGGIESLMNFDLDRMTEEHDVATALKALEVIDQKLEAGDSVLVNCLRGANRSPVLVILYLMLKCNLTWQQAVDHASLCRGLVDVRDPKWGFTVL